MEIEKSPNKLERGISLIIYGDPGVGKTTLATTLPLEDTLVINTEAGIGPLLGKGINLFDVKKAVLNGRKIDKIMDELYLDFRTKKFPFKHVVIDNLSELTQSLLHQFVETRKKEFPEVKEHGDIAFKMIDIVYNWRDLVSYGINVIFNAWEAVYDIQRSDGYVKTQICPMLGPQLAKRASGIVDVVGHLEVYEKSGKRWIRLGPSDQYLTKCQFKGVDSGEPPDLLALIQKIKSYNYKE